MSLNGRALDKKPFCLVGMMGCGKSSVGELLAQQLHVPFYDSDLEIERESGKSITELFQERGEIAFRELERAAILRLVDGVPGVLSIGGGAFIQEANRTVLLERMECFYLKTRPETIYERVKEFTHRPLLQNQDPLGTLKKLLSERESFYQLCPAVVETDGKALEQIVQEIIAAH